MNDDLLTPARRQAIAELIAQQNAIDMEEAGPKAPHGALTYKGVVIDSRWDVLSEYNRMRSIVDRLPDLIRVRIEAIWCDSKCTCNYIVTIKSSKFIADLPGEFEGAVVAVHGGHNGIMIQSDERSDPVFLDCNWGEGPDY